MQRENALLLMISRGNERNVWTSWNWTQLLHDFHPAFAL